MRWAGRSARPTRRPPPAVRWTTRRQSWAQPAATPPHDARTHLRAERRAAILADVAWLADTVAVIARRGALAMLRAPVDAPRVRAWRAMSRRESRRPTGSVRTRRKRQKRPRGGGWLLSVRAAFEGGRRPVRQGAPYPMAPRWWRRRRRWRRRRERRGWQRAPPARRTAAAAAKATLRIIRARRMPRCDAVPAFPACSRPTGTDRRQGASSIFLIGPDPYK